MNAYAVYLVYHHLPVSLTRLYSGKCDEVASVIVAPGESERLQACRKRMDWEEKVLGSGGFFQVMEKVMTVPHSKSYPQRGLSLSDPTGLILHAAIPHCSRTLRLYRLPLYVTGRLKPAKSALVRNNLGKV